MFHVKHFSGDSTTAVHRALTPSIVVRLHFPVLARQGANTENHITERKENMIKVKGEKGYVHVDEMEGNLGQIMSELCCIVDAVCTGFCSDEPEQIKDYMRTKMIRTIAEALIEKNCYEKNNK